MSNRRAERRRRDGGAQRRPRRGGTPRPTSRSGCWRCSSQGRQPAFGRMVAAGGRTRPRSRARTSRPTRRSRRPRTGPPRASRGQGPDARRRGAGLNNAPGGFDAEYDPRLGELTDHDALRRRVQRRHLAGRRRPAKGLEKQLERINALADPIERAEQLAPFRWREGEDPERQGRLHAPASRRRSSPSGAASHQFFLRKKGWSWLGADGHGRPRRSRTSRGRRRRAPDDQARQGARQRQRSARTSSPGRRRTPATR